MGDTVAHGQDILGVAVGLSERGRHVGEGLGGESSEVDVVGAADSDHMLVLQRAPVVHA